MLDVMLYEVFKEERQRLEPLLSGRVNAGFTAGTIEEHGGSEMPAELISVRTQSRIPAAWGKRLKGVLTRSQGYDHLERFRRETGARAALGFLPDYCSRAVAEQAVIMAAALLRKLKAQQRALSTFSRDGLTGAECKGRRALVVGVGNIGSEIVDVARGLRMEVKGVDIIPKLNGVEYVPLDEGMAWAEVIFCAVPLTDETEGMLDAAAFAPAKPGSVFVNIARGEIAPVEGLKMLLNNGTLAGIGLDVYAQEGGLGDALRAGKAAPAGQGRQTVNLAVDDRVMLTPHNAFNTREALERKAALTAEAIMSFLQNRAFPCPVNGS